MTNKGMSINLNIELIIHGYIRIRIKKCIPNDLIKTIIMCVGNMVIFNVYDNECKNIINNCGRIHINGASLFLLDNNKILYRYGNGSGFGVTGFVDERCKSIRKNDFFSDKDISFISSSVVGNHYFIKTSNNKLFAFGNNENRQAGIKKTTLFDFISKPTLIEYKFDSTLKDVKCGSGHSLFLTQNGNVYGSGMNIYGELTDKYIKNNGNIIQCIINGNNVKCIDCGNLNSYILYRNNRLKTFGCKFFDVSMWI